MTPELPLNIRWLIFGLIVWGSFAPFVAVGVGKWLDSLQPRAEWAELREQERRQAAYRRMGGAA